MDSRYRITSLLTWISYYSSTQPRIIAQVYTWDPRTLWTHLPVPPPLLSLTLSLSLSFAVSWCRALVLITYPEKIIIRAIEGLRGSQFYVPYTICLRWIRVWWRLVALGMLNGHPRESYLLGPMWVNVILDSPALWLYNIFLSPLSLSLSLSADSTSRC